MATLASGITKKSASYNADPRAIGRRAGFNPRFDFGDIEALASSIKANGLLQPLRVKRPAAPRDDGKVFELIDGDRRLAAIEQLLSEGVEFPEGVAVKMVDADQDDITSLVQMFETNTGKPFTPLEEAHAFQRMRDAGMTLDMIAASTQRSTNHITDTINLVAAAEVTKSALAAGKVTATAAKEIARVAKGDAALQADLVEAAEKAKSGDEEAKKTLRVKINTQLAKRDEKRGREQKQRAVVALQPDRISKLLRRLNKHFASLDNGADITVPAAELAGLDAIRADDAMVAAYTAGAIHALRAVLGETINLEL